MRLEFTDARTSRFWEISLDGSAITTRWGQIGAEGEVKVERLTSASAARVRYEAQLAEKLRKGYQLAPGQAPVTPTGRVDPKLEAAVRQFPLDERAYLVLADALTEAGDPRGELISVQHAISAAKGAAAAKLKARERKLLSAFGLPEPDLVSFDWRWGFVRAVHFHNNRDWMDGGFDALALARQVFAMPMCAVLEELKVGVLRWDFQEEDVPALLAEAGRQPWAAKLDGLQLGYFPDADLDLAHHPVGDVSFIPTAFPGLGRLFLHAGTFELGPLHLPRLTELTIQTNGMSKQRLRAVTRGRLPRLRSLVLWFGAQSSGADTQLEDLEAVLEGSAFPELRHLGLMNAEFSDGLCEVLGKAKVLPRLEGLDLSMGTMTDAGAAALARNARAFKHLRALRVGDNFLGPEGLKLLGALGCPVVSSRQKDEADYRYVTVGD